MKKAEKYLRAAIKQIDRAMGCLDEFNDSAKLLELSRVKSVIGEIGARISR